MVVPRRDWRNAWERGGHDDRVPRQFRFRVREGHQLHEYGGDNPQVRGAGYEFVLSEEDAARLLRDSHSRRSFDLIEVVNDETTRREEARGRD
jgi:hypothetical protein